MEQPKVDEDGGEELLHKKGPLIVRFPRQATAPVETVKLEAEEAEVERKPPRNMVQVSIVSMRSWSRLYNFNLALQIHAS